MYNVYVLKSVASGLHYVGFTEDINRRLKEHNLGKSKFTKGHIPWKIIYNEKVATRMNARKRERYLKSSAGRRFLKKIL